MSTDISLGNIEESLRYADELKGQGNVHFKAGNWEDALASYRVALGTLPKRKPIPKPKQDLPEDEPLSQVGSSSKDKVDLDVKEEEVPVVLTEEEVKAAKARAVLNANIGACYLKLSEHKEVVNACSEALLDDPHYIKALQRRASSNEQLNTWSSLTSAQEDYNTLLDLLPESSNEKKEIQRTLQRLKPRVEAAQQQETTEMLDKLKGIGNNILGNFGLSTDNFKFVPNGQGGYSMNFNR
ncbi:hypothetical protein BDP27DRAFT_1327814 [Rhodocollybia butyracea]|uniref:TPR-like protein n=1 Tax=Rhodocollybia butyracea TaxID=206335 RepID=A0A9P5PQ80_9AGAR|nr:hypothetical protein BDP27DRAFT_1327814 [Rhodocollybia butyracea]